MFCRKERKASEKRDSFALCRSFRQNRSPYLTFCGVSERAEMEDLHTGALPQRTKGFEKKDSFALFRSFRQNGSPLSAFAQVLSSLYDLRLELLEAPGR